ncbi:hypothetical protein M0813_08313 [Anaeramoeba flamelloides]|uniref:Uncharacterized protein n=1 Tax=Anaeramoeba flamelloides TaxID=1746091 RepID=A0ABQ8X832_9EUKA|nr:hypothetical protein M0813_08313 [Anaeramoeba flamelloides]
MSLLKKLTTSILQSGGTITKNTRTSGRTEKQNNEDKNKKQQKALHQSNFPFQYQIKNPNLTVKNVLEKVPAKFSEKKVLKKETIISDLPENLTIENLNKEINSQQTQLNLVNECLSKQILESYTSFLEELNLLELMKSDLDLGLLFCRSGRLKLFQTHELIVKGSFQIIDGDFEIKFYQKLYEELEKIKHVFALENRITNCLKKMQYSQAFEYCFEANNCASSLTDYKCVGKNWDLTFRKQYDKILSELENKLKYICTRFEPVAFKQIIRGYKQIDLIEQISTNIKTVFFQRMKTGTARILAKMGGHSTFGSISIDELSGFLNEKNFIEFLIKCFEKNLSLLFNHYKITLWLEKKINYFQKQEQKEEKSDKKNQKSEKEENEKGEIEKEENEKEAKKEMKKKSNINKKKKKKKQEKDNLTKTNIESYKNLYNSLIESKKFIWENFQKFFETLVFQRNSKTKLNLFKFETFLSILHLIGKFVELGEDYSGLNSSKRIRSLIIEQSKQYFENYQLNSINEINNLLTVEAWVRCPVGTELGLSKDFNFYQDENQEKKKNNSNKTNNVENEKTNIKEEHKKKKLFQLRSIFNSQSTWISGKNNYHSEEPDLFEKFLQNINKVLNSNSKKISFFNYYKQNKNPFSNILKMTFDEEIDPKKEKGNEMENGNEKEKEKEKKQEKELNEKKNENENENENENKNGNEKQKEKEENNEYTLKKIINRKNDLLSNDLEINQELLGDYIDSNGVSKNMKVKFNVNGPILTSTVLNMIRMIGKYLNLMENLNNISNVIFNGLIQTFESYFYIIYDVFKNYEAPPNLTSKSFGLSHKDLKKKFNFYMTAPQSIIKKIEEIKINKSNEFLLKLDASNNIDITTSKNYYGLEKRVIAIESLLFLRYIMQSLKGRIYSHLPKTKLENCNIFYNKTLTTAKKLENFLYKLIICLNVDIKSFSNLMSNVKWDSENLGVNYSSYVDQLKKIIFNFSEIINSSNELQTLRKPKEKLWKHFTILLMDILLDSFGNIKKCSSQGRARMSYDLVEIETTLKKFSKINTPKLASNVRSYIKAYYQTEDELLEWIKKNSKIFTFQQIRFLAICSVGRKMKKKAKKAYLNTVSEIFEENK